MTTDRGYKLTKPQREELERLVRHGRQPTYGAARARVQNRLVAEGLACYCRDGTGDVADWCLVTEAGRRRLEAEAAKRQPITTGRDRSGRR